MPLANFAKNHFTDSEKQQLNDAINSIKTLLAAKTYDLSPKERTKYGKVGNQKKLLLNKVKDYRESQPNLSSPDVDWTEFEADYATRNFAEMKLLELKNAMQMMLNIKILHDYDNMKDALQDYHYTVYKSEYSNQSGFSEKAAKLKQFFPKTGKKKKKDS